MKDAIYPVFTSKKTNKKLAFYPVKKNANTSSKFFFASHLGIENDYFFIEDKIPRFKQTKKMHADFKNQYNLINLYQGKYRFEKVNIEFKSCIVRDPIERFVSAYKNRIMFHKDEEFYNYSIDDVLENLEGGVVENKHFLPQNYFLGNDLSYFDIIGSVSNIKFFEEKINNFFNQKRSFPKLQTGGKEFKLILTIEQKNKIKKIYEKDYDLVVKYL